MGWDDLLRDIASAHQRLDGSIPDFLDLAERHRTRIYCEKGCCNCCTLAVNCSFPEALAISRMLSAVQQIALAEKLPVLREISRQAGSLKDFLRLFRERLAGCPFLDHADGSCSIYPVRPFSCRALLSTRNSSWCAVDFASLHPLEQEAFLSSLDPELVAFPTHYLAASRDLGLELENQAVAAMRTAFGIGLSGTLIYLVWLEQEYQLSEGIEQGTAATLKFVKEHNLDLPYLLQWSED